MAGIAQCDLNRIYDWFGIDGEILYDHAWGREPTTVADVKGYKSKTKSLSSSQVLFRDYKFSEGETIAKEMMDQLCLDMAAKKLAQTPSASMLAIRTLMAFLGQVGPHSLHLIPMLQQ